MATVGRDLRELAGATRERLPEIVEDLMERQWREVPEFFVTDDPAYLGAVRRSTAEGAELILHGLDRPAPAPPFLCPAARLEADLAAQHGTQLPALLRTYRLGQQVIGEHLVDTCARGGAGAGGEALKHALHSVYRWTDTVMPLVAREYVEEAGRRTVAPATATLREVQAVLAGAPPIGLDYSWDAEHVALVCADAGVALPLGEVAADLGADALIVPLPSGGCWAWLTTGDAAALGERLRRAGSGTAAGIGGPAHGTSGFRRAHGQAQLAWRIARARGEIVDVRSVALEGFALGDQAIARELVLAELGPLAADDERSVRLRRTLRVWFAHQESLAASAAALSVAPRTVSYRLRRAETLLGHAIAERRAELETALRLLPLFDPGGEHAASP